MLKALGLTTLKTVSDLLRAIGAHLDRPRPLGRCPGCFTTVYSDDPHVRYRGAYFHAEPCVEISPVAFRDRQ